MNQLPANKFLLGDVRESPAGTTFIFYEGGILQVMEGYTETHYLGFSSPMAPLFFIARFMPMCKVAWVYYGGGNMPTQKPTRRIIAPESFAASPEFLAQLPEAFLQFIKYAEVS